MDRKEAVDMTKFVWYTEADMPPESRLAKAERVRDRLVASPPPADDSWSSKKINNWLDRYIRVRNVIWNEKRGKDG